MSNFKSVFKEALAEFGLSLDNDAVERFCIYNDMLIDYNQKINLTALTEPRDVAVKHFVDSLMLLRYAEIEQEASVIDVGTGAGFPGLALKIARPDISLTMLDSLQKRLLFLDEVSDALELDGVVTVHSRAEDGARTILFRDSYDIAVARAVAPLNVLCEYCLPYVKEGGRFLAMKGKTAREELQAAENALRELCGEVIKENYFELGDAGERGVIEIKKTAPTPAQYPRKAKAIKKKPL